VRRDLGQCRGTVEGEATRQDHVTPSLPYFDKMATSSELQRSISEEACGSYEKHQTIRPHLNRLVFCLLSIGLVWLTTLDQAYQIVDNAISSPRFEAVVDTCLFAQSQTESQSQKYDMCSKLQLKKCDESYKNSLIVESARNQKTILNNIAVSDIVKYHVDYCANLTREFIIDLGNWKTREQVIYLESCSPDDIAKVNSIIAEESGAVVSRVEQQSFTEALEQSIAAAREWTNRTAASLNHVIDYAESLDRYNRNYMANKTARMQMQSVELLRAVAVDSLSAEGLLGGDGGLLRAAIQDALRGLLSCTAIGPIEEIGQCRLPIRAAMDVYKNDVLGVAAYNELILRGIGELIKTSFNDYMSLATAAIAKANDFFEAVVGASGMVMWVQNNLVQYSPVTVSLCNAGPRPSWCSYSYVS
jgi:hypothetical protein